MNQNNVILEVASFTPSSALHAFAAGAGRIELCSGYLEGGLSPSAGTISYVRDHVSIPVFVMIRPRVGDFIYDNADQEIILKDIEYCREIGIDGIVTGALTSSGSPDKDFLKQVVQTASGLPVTFHRAFDLCGDMQQSMEDLIECGVRRILTSGGKNNVPEGLDTIRSLVKAAGDRIIILPGGGINAKNVKSIIQLTGVSEIHCSGKELVSSPMQAKAGISLCSFEEVSDYNWFASSMEKIKGIIAQLNT